ncbi:MAG: hypothetical protein IJT27_09885 [Clostridia bacterium]|nr:hypothetical protein [Clostridia bacterium]
MADFNDKLPDISGVFDIDESKIPNKIIEKRPEDAASRKPAEPVMLRGPVAREEKKEEKHERTQRQKGKKTAAQKQRSRKLILIGAAALALLILILAVKGLIDKAKRPVVTLETALVGTVTAHYDSTATIVRDPQETGEDRLYAVFVENNYDVYGIQENQKATLTNAEGRTVTGAVYAIRKEDTNSSLIERIISLITDTVVATNANYTVIILPDDPTAVVENETVSIQVVTAEVKNVLTVPSDAVRVDNGQTYVWLYKSFGKKLLRKDVTIGLSSDGLTQIDKGLNTGDMVAVTWSCEETDLHDGIKVRQPKK